MNMNYDFFIITLSYTWEYPWEYNIMRMNYEWRYAPLENGSLLWIAHSDPDDVPLNHVMLFMWNYKRLGFVEVSWYDWNTDEGNTHTLFTPLYCVPHDVGNWMCRIILHSTCHPCLFLWLACCLAALGISPSKTAVPFFYFLPHSSFWMFCRSQSQLAPHQFILYEVSPKMARVRQRKREG